jgi:pimeloyl-ACP methyl ester carboxylesterase
MATHIRLDGVPTWYDEHGARSGGAAGPAPPGRSRRAGVRAHLDARAAHFRVLTPDRRGHDHSPDVDGPTYEPMAQDTIAFLEAVVAGSAHLAGCSDGMPVALGNTSKEAWH